MTQNTYIYIFIMAAVSYAIRMMPLTFIRTQIKNPFLQSFLYYVPYVTLAVMTFPAILDATQSPISGALALLVGIAAAWFGANLFTVAVCCCAVVFVAEFFC
ncbi:MAG: AzlD domain-containing protein [Lachnoclostridium sp.]|nr:AzlD domain-containing protein [Lachnospira sp.]MCM1247913.1 AzlD domain-containing protein [Lachnoclostridium sp.]MCM1535714.1 AzlD domain-containing protein [Clostridium sp.]